MERDGASPSPKGTAGNGDTDKGTTESLLNTQRRIEDIVQGVNDTSVVEFSTASVRRTGVIESGKIHPLNASAWHCHLCTNGLTPYTPNVLESSIANMCGDAFEGIMKRHNLICQVNFLRYDGDDGTAVLSDVTGSLVCSILAEVLRNHEGEL